MHPVLLKIGPLTLHTYGFFLALGFLAGMGIVSRQARIEGLDRDRIMDLCLVSLLTAVLAARVPYVLLHLDQFAGNWLGIFKLWEEGLVFYGGFVGAAGVFTYYVVRHKLPFLKVADLFSLGVPLGHAIGRLGCFSAGCCYGRPTDLPWAVKFSDPACLAPRGIGLHPTQIYSCLGNLGIFLFLYFWLLPRRRFDGQLFCAFVVVYGIFRFLIEFIRADDRGQYLLGASPTQVLSAVLAVIALACYLYLRDRAQKIKAAPKPGKKSKKAR